MIRRGLTPFLLLLGCLVVLAGCGSSDTASSGTADPAQAAPRAAFLFASVVVRPDGDLGAAVDAVGRKILRGKDLGTELHRLIDKAARSNDPKFSYAKDVQPWLGKRAGAFLTGVQGGRAHGAVVVSTKDENAARDAQQRLEKRDPGTEREREYRGEKYLLDASGSSGTAVVGGYLIGGDEAGIKAAIDALKGSSLADAESYRQATAKVTQNGLATFYVDAPRLLDLAAQANPRAAAVIAQLRSLPQVQNLKPVAAALTVKPDAIALEYPSSGDGKAADAVAALPADSWLAFAAPSAGDSIRRQIQVVSQLQGGNSLEIVKRQFRAQVGLDLDRDLLDWIGGMSFYVGGTSLRDLNGALIIDSRDPAASQAAIARIGRVVRRRAKVPVSSVAGGFQIHPPNAPAPITVAAVGDKVVVAYGEDGVRRALHPSGKLEGAPAYAAAQKALGGGRPSFMVSVPEILKLVRSLGAGSSPKYQQVESYLRTFDAIAAGHAESDGHSVAKIAVGVK
jgi:Protein of unknown function (DUF3352)